MNALSTCREYATEWVHLYAAGGAAFAILSVPLTTSAGLTAAETFMIYWIGKIYGEELSSQDILMVGGMLELASLGLKSFALGACNLLPVVGRLIKGGIAAGTIEALGHLVIWHFERKYPGQLYPPTRK